MSRLSSGWGRGVLLAGAALAGTGSATAQTGCTAGGYRVVGHRWDAVLRRSLELRQDCKHPEWPAKVVPVSSGMGNAAGNSIDVDVAPSQIEQPLLVRAGEQVKLWMQDARVRIEMSGVVEQSARSGEHVVVRVMRQSDEAGLMVERISGTVRGAGEVEMDR